MISTERLILIILVAAVFTFLTRLLPFIFFRGREVPAQVRYLGGFLPPALIATLVVYCLKTVSFTPDALPSAAAQLLGVLGVALLHLWKRNTLISVGGGTVIYMLLLRLLNVV